MAGIVILSKGVEESEWEGGSIAEEGTSESIASDPGITGEEDNLEEEEEGIQGVESFHICISGDMVEELRSGK